MPLIDLRSPAIYASLEDIYKEFSGGNIDPRYGTGNYDMTPFYVIHNSQSFWREGMLNELRYISDADKSVRFVVGRST